MAFLYSISTGRKKLSFFYCTSDPSVFFFLLLSNFRVELNQGKKRQINLKKDIWKKIPIKYEIQQYIKKIIFFIILVSTKPAEEKDQNLQVKEAERQQETEQKNKVMAKVQNLKKSTIKNPIYTLKTCWRKWVKSHSMQTCCIYQVSKTGETKGRRLHGWSLDDLVSLDEKRRKFAFFCAIWLCSHYTLKIGKNCLT